MTILRNLCGAALLVAAGIAHADSCKLTIETSDQARFNMREIAVPGGCTEIEVNLKHSGKLPAKVMAHDWVLAKESDVSAILHAGMAAGYEGGYLLRDDQRVIAATGLVGGGETATVRFPSSLLQPGTRYAFFCSWPGHSSLMRGSLVFGGTGSLASAR